MSDFFLFSERRKKRMRRSIKKQFYMNRKEDELLKKKARKAGLTEAALIRFLVKGYEPREKPDEDFYDEMKKITELTTAVSRIAAEVKYEDMKRYLEFEIKKWHMFQSELEAKYLTPEENKRIWQ